MNDKMKAKCYRLDYNELGLSTLCVEKDKEIERLNNILDTLMQDMALLNATSKKEIKPKYVFDRIATLRGVDKE